MLSKLFLSVVDILISLLLRLAIVVISHLPVCFIYTIAKILGYALYWLMPKKRRCIENNFKIVYPQGLPFDQKKMTRKIFENFCSTIGEFFLARRILNHDNWRTYIHGEALEYMQQEIDKLDSGALFVTGHIGSFLSGSHVPSFLKRDSHIVIRAQGLPRTSKAFSSLFEWSGGKVILKKSAYSAMQELLERKGYPIVAMDQHAGRKALHVDFLGKKAYTAAGVVSLARKYQVPIFVAVLIRTGKFSFEFYTKKIPYLKTEDKQTDLETMATQINQQLGEYILQYPDQWFWMHRRWRE